MTHHVTTTTTLRSHRAAVVATALIAVSLLTGCAATTGSPASPDSPASSASGAPVSPISTQTLAGAPITLPASGKPTLLIFYSVECGACVDVTKRISSISTTFPEADYIAVNVAGEDPATQDAFLEYIGNPALVGVEDGGAIVQAFSVKALSIVVVTDKTGHVVLQAVEPSTETMMNALRQASV